MVRKKVLAVLGPGAARDHEIDLALEIGKLAAACGWVVLTGGGPGVMEAACRGAIEAGGLTIGVLPVATEARGYPNRWVVVPIFTGQGMARNAINVLSADLCVAVGGGAGTLSEIALALKAGIEVWTVASWALEPPSGTEPAMPRVFADADDLLHALSERLR